MAAIQIRGRTYLLDDLQLPTGAYQLEVLGQALDLTDRSLELGDLSLYQA